MNIDNPRTIAVFAAIALMTLPFAAPATAQQRPGPVVELAAGSLLFADDGVVAEGFVGGTGRFHVLPRISVGPEVAYVRGERHSHMMLTGNVTFDFLRPAGAEPRRIAPFAVVGGGLFRTREQFPNEVFTSSEGAFTAGAGVRALAGERVMIGAEARVGWELHLRLNGTIGVRLGRK
jgi:hypothetical protein